jgi:hypothetical protein
MKDIHATSSIDRRRVRQVSTAEMHTQTRVAAPWLRRCFGHAATRVTALGLVLLVSLSQQPRAACAGETASPQPQPRIVNGVLSTAYPTTVAVLFGNDPIDPTDVTTECSGVLVGCQTVLTAAHCVCPDQTDTASACIAAGLADPSTLSVFLQHAGVFPVASITINPSYQFGVSSDIAILKLATPVSGIAPSHINTTQAPAAGTTGIIVGFGLSIDTTGDSGLKRAGKVVTARCQPPIPNSTNVCWDFVNPIGPVGEDSNTCNGDSGGPLFINFGAGDQVAGLTSGGEPTCAPNSISWDTSVFNDRAFVQTEAGADLDNASCGDLPQVGQPGTEIIANSGNVSAAQQESRSTFQVPAGTRLLRVALNGADADTSAHPVTLNDFDLYIKAGSPPTTTDFDCSDIGAAPYGFCEITNPAAGTWNVLVDRVEGAGTYQVTATTFAAMIACAGDCNGDGAVTVDELIKGVNIALGTAPLDQCPSFDANGDLVVTVDELIRAVNNALAGCAAG